MILCFSATGNTACGAGIIANELGDRVVSLNDRIKKGDFSSVNSNKPFVIMFPIYAWNIPGVVADYIKRTEFKGCSDVYFVATLGDSSGRCDSYCRRLCDSKGLAFRGFRGVVMPDTYIVLYELQSDDESQRKIERAKDEFIKIAEDIKSGKAIEKTDKITADFFMSSVVNVSFKTFMATGRGLYVNAKCVGCGKCQDLCPVNNIKIVGGKPTFGRDCIHCLSCIHLCPTQAINIKGKTEKRGRYRLAEKYKRSDKV